MDAEKIKELIAWLQNRVSLDEAVTEGIALKFEAPTDEDLKAAGFSQELIERTTHADWWSEMILDINETPAYAEPGEGPEKVLQYARDVVDEYIRKRLNP